MSRTNPAVDTYLRESNKWQDEFKQLRIISLGCGLTEALKWGKPCYSFQDSNIVLIQGFKEYCALMFCKGALLKDAKGILIQQTAHVQAARQIRFTNVREIVKMKPVLKDYIQEAIEAERAGMKVTFQKNPEPIPEELQSKMDEDSAFGAAFAALTPGRRRGYILHFSAPKQSKTRQARIERCEQQILSGKGMHDYPREEANRPGSGSGETSPALESKEKGTSLASKPKLLSGGNPQIAKGDGDAPVQAYIAAMPGWKRALGKRLDAIIMRNVPAVRKAVRWNSPFYGIEGQGWFLSYHVFTRYVKVTFFAGMSLRPIPPGGTEKSQEARWIDIYEDEFDEAQMTTWVKQAAAVPGWIP